MGRDVIQKSAQALSFNLDQVMRLFEANAQLLKEAHAYPTSSFPGHVHEYMLSQLLRKKLEPGAEDWIYEHTTKRQAEQQANGVSKHDHGLKDDDLRELWSWASETSRSIVVPMVEDGGAMADNYTIAEREAGVENVSTGLRRDLDRDSEDDDEDDDDDIDENGMEDIVPSEQSTDDDEEGIDESLPPMPLENVLRFMTTGALPNTARSNR